MSTLHPQTELNKGREDELQYLPSMPRVFALAGQRVLNWLAQYLTGVSLLSILVALVLWGISFQGVALDRIDDLGLMSVLPWAYYAAFVFLTISFALTLHQRRINESILLLNLIVLVFIIHGTPQVLYGTPRYAWVWKHIGIVDYIQRHGSVNPNLDAYQNWPGFFALAALFTEAMGFDSAIGFAGWGPVFFNLLFVGALLMIFKSLTRDRRLVWLGVWFFVLANWIGQDYFSPQAFSYFLYMLVLGVCLNWFRVTTPQLNMTILRRFRLDRLESLLHNLLKRAPKSAPPQPPSKPPMRVGLMMVVILIMGVMAVSHQLTPFMLISALAALVIFQIISTRSLPLLMIVFTGTWIIYFANAFLEGNVGWVAASVGHLTSKNPDLVNLSIASPDQVFVAVMGRVFIVLIVGLSLLGGIRRLRAGYLDLTAVVLIIVPSLMLVANSYGGEMLYRSYFFALPFLAFLVGALVYPSPAPGSSWHATAMTVLLSCTMLVGLLFAYYGKERMNYFTQNEIDAAEYIYQNAPAGSVVVSETWDYPALFHNYEYYTSVTICCGSNKLLPRSKGTLVEKLVRLMNPYPAGFVILSRGQRAQIEMSGLIPHDELDSIEYKISQSKNFGLIYSNADAEVFMLVNHGDGSKQ